MEKITNDLYYVGVQDHQIDLFEGIYHVPHGMSYNSYVFMDEKIAILDSVDIHFGLEWIQKVKEVLNGKTPDYFIIQHMEPDHSASIQMLIETYPQIKLVGNVKTFTMFHQYFAIDTSNQEIIVRDMDTLTLGKHTLTFVLAPMVHWPEVMVTYDNASKTLFSADGFGKFGALDVEEDWVEEARRYYFGIVGKYGAPVQTLLKKASTLDIQMICPLHGPILKENIQTYLHLYDVWSSYSFEKDGIVIAYTSVYQNTKKAVETLEYYLKQNTSKEILTIDLARTDMSIAVAKAFQYKTLVLATTTYNGTLFPFMREFIHELSERNFQNRLIGIIENGSWAPMVSKKIKEHFENSKQIQWIEPIVTLRSSMSNENQEQLRSLANELVKA